MSGGRFTGERLHSGDGLFAVDLARHRAAYRWALERRPQALLLDVGCGSGHGVALLAAAGLRAVGVDLAFPDRVSRVAPAMFVRGAIGALPFASRSFERIASFQVLEHLEAPERFVMELARILDAHGELLITTPNQLTSDGLNPYHVHEYTGDELERLLAPHFEELQVLGVGASDRAQPYYDQRLATLRKVERLDVVGLHRRLPRGLRLWLFARAAVAMRLLLRRRGAVVPGVDESDFPIGPLDERALDLVAVCRSPRG
jgi:SAM-dependent methyltransferase